MNGEPVRPQPKPIPRERKPKRREAKDPRRKSRPGADPGRLEFCRSRECVGLTAFPGHVCRGDVQASHLRRNTGLARKEHDDKTWPMCAGLHLDQWERHRGEFDGWDSERRYLWALDRIREVNLAWSELTPEQQEWWAGMADAVRANPLAMKVLDGEREKTYTWRLQGRLCRGTPDVRGKNFLTELKTGETADPRFFPFKVRRFCYHGQLAWYSDGAVLAGLPGPEEHYVVAVEAAPPHVVTVFRIAPETIEKGRRLVRLWFERLLQCEAAQEWPGYSQSVVELALPDFEFDPGDGADQDVEGTPEEAIT